MLFIYLFFIYFIGFILIFMKVIIPIALTYIICSLDLEYYSFELGTFFLMKTQQVYTRWALLSHTRTREIKFYPLNYPYPRTGRRLHPYPYRTGKNTRRVTRTRMHTHYKPKEHEYIISLESYIVNSLPIEINNYNIATKLH
jgi:hypothetical protein